MRLARIGSAALEYTSIGSGEPVILIHGVGIAEGLLPLAKNRRLSRDYRIISYHRRGYAGSSRLKGIWSIQAQAKDCRELLRFLRIHKAHVVGHSYGGVIAVQLALDYPEVIQTITLIEPALVNAIKIPDGFGKALEQATNAFQLGQRQLAMQRFLGAVTRSPKKQYSASFSQRTLDLAVKDSDTLFKAEIPALDAWRFSGLDAQKIKQPILSVIGEKSSYPSKMIGEVISSWFPQSKTIVLSSSNHWPQFTNNNALVDAIIRFIRKYPIVPPQVALSGKK